MSIRFLAIATLFFAAACGCSDPDPRPDVLVVVLDTVRQDRTSAFGYARPTTPHLDTLADQGVRYPNTWSTSGWTSPAHASIFTGLYAVGHGATQEAWSLESKHRTLAEHLGDAGYETVGVIGNPMVSAAHGFARGFEQYREHWRRELKAGRSPDVTSAGWIEKRLADRTGKRPMFLFVNLIGAHGPYTSCGAHCGQFGAALKTGIVDNGWKAFYMGRKRFNEKDYRRLSDLYDAEVAQVDDVLGRILSAWDASTDNSIVIVTADHGENIGEHGHVNHVFSLHETTTRVPLVVRGLGAAGTEEKRTAQVHDLFPTVLAVAGIAVPDDQHGISLANLPDDRAVLAEYYRPTQALRRILEQANDEETTRVEKYQRRIRTRIEDGWKLHWGSDGKHELFHLAEDPAERVDVLATHPEKAAELTAALEAHVQSMAVGDGVRLEIPQVDEATRKALEELGYLE